MQLAKNALKKQDAMEFIYSRSSRWLRKNGEQGIISIGDALSYSCVGATFQKTGLTKRTTWKIEPWAGLRSADGGKYRI
jgi:hypothetical protein